MRPTSRVFVGEIWAPCARPELANDEPPDPEALSFEWTDRTIAILAILREIVLERIAYARTVGAVRHVRVGLAAVGILETIVAERPRGVVLEPGDILGAGLFVYFDILVMQFEAMGTVRASEVLRRMGWRLPRDERAAVVHAPPPPRYSSSWYTGYAGNRGSSGRIYTGDFRSPERHGSAAPPRHSPDAHSRGHAGSVSKPEAPPPKPAPAEVRSERPVRKYGGEILSPSKR